MAAITHTVLPYGKSLYPKYFMAAITQTVLPHNGKSLYQKYFRKAWQLSPKLFYLFMAKVCIKNIHKNILVQTCRLMI